MFSSTLYSVPFRHPGLQYEADGESPLPPSTTHSKTHSSHSHIVEGIKHHTAGKKQATGRNGVPSDSQLLGSMASRLAQVERELLVAKRETIEKDNLIRQLKERITVLEGSCDQGSQQRELQIKCLALQKQIDEMEVLAIKLMIPPNVHAVMPLSSSISRNFSMIMV